MREYNVRLTEREVKEVGATRWQRASWKKLTLFVALLVVWIFAAWSYMLALTVEGTTVRWLGALAVPIPVIGFAVWFLKRAARVGKEFLKDVSDKQTD